MWGTWYIEELIYTKSPGWMRKKYLHSTLNRTPRSNNGSHMTNEMELTSVLQTMLFQMGWNSLAFSVQGPGVTAGLWFLLKAWCLAPRAYHPSNIPFLGEVSDHEHWAQGKEKNRRKAIGLFTLNKVKQNIGNMPLAMEYRNVFFPPGHQSPPSNEGKSKLPDVGPALVGEPSGENSPL